MIVLLALLDVFLLGLLMSRRLEERAAWERTVTQLVSLFDAGGITLPASLVPAGELHLSPLEPARNLDMEAAFAEALLGPCECEDVGGGIYRYVSQSGQCLLRSGGLVEAALEREVDDPKVFCEILFSAFGYVPLSFALDDGTGSVSAVKLQSGIMVFNAHLTLDFSNGRLVEAGGSFVPAFDSVERGGGLDGVTALVRFLDYGRSNGEVCTAVTGVNGGYLLQSTASAPQRLVPVWCVETDVYNYYVNIATGEVNRES